MQCIFASDDAGKAGSLVYFWEQSYKVCEFLQGQVITINCDRKIWIQDDTCGQFRGCLCVPHRCIPRPSRGPASGLVQLQRKRLDWCCPTEGSNRQPQAHGRILIVLTQISKQDRFPLYWWWIVHSPLVQFLGSHFTAWSRSRWISTEISCTGKIPCTELCPQHADRSSIDWNVHNSKGAFNLSV